MISITGLSKSDVLAALYNASRPLGMGFMQYDPKPMERAEAEVFLSQGEYFDYLKGRVMKLNLDRPDSFNEREYDHNNGNGAAQAAIDALRTSGTSAIEIQAAHEIGKQVAADDTLKRLHTPTTFSNGVMTLGLDDVAEPLREAIRKAVDPAEA